MTANGFKPIPPFTSAAHILGTDQLGQDMLSRLLDGARISLTRGDRRPVRGDRDRRADRRDRRLVQRQRIDNGLMRFTDVMYAFPDLLLIILFSVAFRETAFGQALNGLLLVFVAIGLVSWVTVARLVRGQFLSLKETEFVEAAQAIGVSDRNIIMKHLLPNGIGPIIVAITLGIPAAILAEATLAYIGVGVQPPRASWGSLIAAGQPFIRSYPAPDLHAGHPDRAGADQLHLPRGRPARRARPEAQGKAIGDRLRGRVPR